MKKHPGFSLARALGLEFPGSCAGRIWSQNCWCVLMMRKRFFGENLRDRVLNHKCDIIAFLGLEPYPSPKPFAEECTTFLQLYHIQWIADSWLTICWCPAETLGSKQHCCDFLLSLLDAAILTSCGCWSRQWVVWWRWSWLLPFLLGMVSLSATYPLYSIGPLTKILQQAFLQNFLSTSCSCPHSGLVPSLLSCGMGATAVGPPSHPSS